MLKKELMKDNDTLIVKSFSCFIVSRYKCDNLRVPETNPLVRAREWCDAPAFPWYFSVKRSKSKQTALFLRIIFTGQRCGRFPRI